MKIGIIGSGNIGGTLGTLWAAKGHEIVFGVRDTQSEKVVKLLEKAGKNSCADSIAEAVQYGDVILVAVPWKAVTDVVEQGGDWAGKIVIDATNRFGVDSPNSGAEDLAQLIPDARVVKAFNAIGFNRLDKPELNGQTADIFICGDDDEAKAKVSALSKDIGFDVVDCGALANAELVESLARLWITLSRTMGRDIAFKLLREA